MVKCPESMEDLEAAERHLQFCRAERAGVYETRGLDYDRAERDCIDTAEDHTCDDWCGDEGAPICAIWTGDQESLPSGGPK